MNRRAIVVSIGVIAAVVFAGAAYLYSSRDTAAIDSSTDVTAMDITRPADIVPAQQATPVTPATPVDAPPSPVGAPSPSTAPAAPAAAPAAQSATAKWTSYVRQHSPILGRPDARVTIVEFLDPACEACRAFYPIVHEILRRHPNDVRVVIRYTPLHDGSEEAIRILETAKAQNVFEPVLAALFEQQPRWASHQAPNLQLAWDAAAGAGLDVAAARAAMDAAHIDTAITQDVKDANDLSVRGTPTFFVNEKPLKEFGPQQLYNLVVAEIEATR